ncbi:hypothetical protein ACSSS7_000405 [Eimeria intestinalis]
MTCSIGGSGCCCRCCNVIGPSRLSCLAAVVKAAAGWRLGSSGGRGSSHEARQGGAPTQLQLVLQLLLQQEAASKKYLRRRVSAPAATTETQDAFAASRAATAAIEATATGPEMYLSAVSAYTLRHIVNRWESACISLAQARPPMCNRKSSSTKERIRQQQPEADEYPPLASQSSFLVEAAIRGPTTSYR